jgi:hypothetical protein
MEPSSYYAVTGTVINGTRSGIGNLIGNYNLDVLDDRFDGLTYCQKSL